MSDFDEDGEIRAVVVSPPFAWLAKLATALAHQSSLAAYVTPIVETGTGWQRWTSRLPLIGPKLAKDFHRRPLPPAVDVSLVHTAASMEEVIRVAVSRMPVAPTDPLTRRIMHRRNRLLSEAGARALVGANVVVATHDAALEAFHRAREIGALCILDYPITHHRFSARLMSDEAARKPEFAKTLQWRKFSEAFEGRLDEECELADYILTGSTFARNSFIEEGIAPSKVLAIPYGVDSDKFEPCSTPITDEVFRVLFVGSIGQRKGISYLLDAYSRFAKRDSELMLVGNHVGDLRGFRPYQHLYTHVPHAPYSKMPGIFSAASVFVFPSLLEGLGIVVLEAMASGLPVIVTANGPGDVVRDGIDGYVVAAGDSEAITDRLNVLYNDPTLRRRMGEQARVRAMEFTWNRYCSNVIGAVRMGLCDSEARGHRLQGDKNNTEDL